MSLCQTVPLYLPTAPPAVPGTLSLNLCNINIRHIGGVEPPIAAAPAFEQQAASDSGKLPADRCKYVRKDRGRPPRWPGHGQRRGGSPVQGNPPRQERNASEITIYCIFLTELCALNGFSNVDRGTALQEDDQDLSVEETEVR